MSSLLTAETRACGCAKGVSMRIDTYAAVLSLPSNTRGRDFVTGDVHGAIDLVYRALDKARIDPSCDRLFIPGDYIDRGPQSHRCVDLLREPFVFGTMGNHERDLIDFYDQGLSDEVMAFVAKRNINGMRWIAQTTPEVLADVVSVIRKLPIAMEVETERGLVGFVHAEVPPHMTWSEFVDRIRGGDPDTIHSALKGRNRIQSGDCSGVPGIGRVFVGHTIQWNGVQRYGNVVAVDTGSVVTQLRATDEARLTMLNVQMKTSTIDIPPPGGPLDVRNPTHVPAVPFGQSGIVCSMKRVRP